MIKWITGLVIPPWVKPLLFSIFVVVVAWQSFNDGVKHEHDKKEAADNKELVKKQQRILELTTMNRELERKAAEDNTTINNLYQERTKNEQAKANSIIHDVRTGNKRLFVNVKPPARPSGGSETSGIAAVRLPSDATTRSELSDADAEFLISFASEADQVVNQLQLCQGKLLIDRNLSVPDLQLVPTQLESKD